MTDEDVQRAVGVLKTNGVGSGKAVYVYPKVRRPGGPPPPRSPSCPTAAWPTWRWWRRRGPPSPSAPSARCVVGGPPGVADNTLALCICNLNDHLKTSPHRSIINTVDRNREWLLARETVPSWCDGSSGAARRGAHLELHQRAAAQTRQQEPPQGDVDV